MLQSTRRNKIIERSAGSTEYPRAAEGLLATTTGRRLRRLVGTLVAVATAATLGLSAMPASAEVMIGAEGYCEPGQTYPGYEMYNTPTSLAIDKFPVVRLTQPAPSGNSQTYRFAIYLRYWTGSAWMPIDSADTWHSPTYSTTLNDWTTTNLTLTGKNGFWYGRDGAGATNVIYLPIPWKGGFYYEAGISIVGYNNLNGKQIFSSWSLVPLRPATGPSWCRF